MRAIPIRYRHLTRESLPLHWGRGRTTVEAFDLFYGAGGLTRGLQYAGWEVVAGLI